MELARGLIGCHLRQSYTQAPSARGLPWAGDGAAHHRGVGWNVAMADLGHRAYQKEAPQTARGKVNGQLDKTP